MGLPEPGGSLAPDRRPYPTGWAAKERACASSPPRCPVARGAGDRQPHRRRGAQRRRGPATRWCSPAGPGPEEWHDVTAAEFLVEVRGVAKGLVAAGVRPGDRVALISRTRYEWTLFDYAIWFAGAVGVPVYETSSAEQVGWILRDSGAVRRGRRGTLPPEPDRRGPRRPRGAAPRLVDRRQRRRRAHPARAPTSPTPSSSRGGPPRPRSTWPRSSTPRAPPAAPRAACSPTATS